jgi:hypothetical protein
MLTRVLKRFMATVGSTAISTLPVPTYSLKTVQLVEPPKLYVRSHKFLLKHWWSETPFEKKSQLNVPIFSLKTGEYTGTSACK